MHAKKLLGWIAIASSLVTLGACGGAHEGETPKGGPGDITTGGGGGGGGSGGGDGTGGGGGGAVDSGSTGGDETDSGSAGGGGGADTGTSEPGDPSTPYPAGPYGFEVGDVMGNYSFMGYRNGTGAWTTIKLSDYYDPDGKRGIRALYVTLGEVGCGACVQEAPKINDWKAKYAPAGAAFLSGLWRGEIKHADGKWYADQETVDLWVKEFKVTYDMMADPKIQLAGGVEPTTNPQGWLIDVRTMKIVQHYPGAPGFLYGMDALLKKNGATL